MSGHRLTEGGLIDRASPLSIRFDGAAVAGFAGDTVASALIASGRRLVGRSFKYHRPRGIFSAGTDEPNALVTLHDGGRQEPNVQATMAEAYDGLMVRSQNAWPSLRHDLLAVNGLLSPVLAAGFYYKTFIGPTARSWMFYEPFIRRSAGLGRASALPDPATYDRRNHFCDLLVAGGGPSGLAAALVAARSGLRVTVADDREALGGALRGSAEQIDGQPADAWIVAALAELATLGAQVLARTTVFGYYDHQVLGAVERVTDHLAAPPAQLPRQRFWTIRARHVVLAAGAFERPLVCSGNDRPGVMLADSVRRYADVWGVACGRSVALVANNDSAYGAALSLHGRGVKVTAILDLRVNPSARCHEIAEEIGAPLRAGHEVRETRGRRGVEAVCVGPRSGGESRWIEADCLAMSGGWSPAVHLASQMGSPPVFDSRIRSFVPGSPGPTVAWTAAGAMLGRFGTADCFASGAEAGKAAVEALDHEAAARTFVVASRWLPGDAPEIAAPPKSRGKMFVDFQNDVTASDVGQAVDEGFHSVEHLKRYTTLGMATDQGKGSNLNAMALVAAKTGRAESEVGTTRFRPPYTPVAFGALVGRHRGTHVMPLRRSPMHDWHEAHGGLMSPVAAWMRPRAYLGTDETIRDAYIREAANVRARVGLCDVSTLGKIEVQGPDAAEFLNRVYTNPFLKLTVGRARYGLMLRDDGMLLDDGTVWRLGETRFLVTTTTGGAGTVMLHMERLAALFWPDLRVSLVSVTGRWAGMSLAGPQAREVLAAFLPGTDVSDAALPFMGVLQIERDGVPLVVARLSFSGEMAYEVFAGADHGLAVWKGLLAAGAPMGIMPYGTEALGTLRIEKGHVAGGELDSRLSAQSLGLGGMLSKRKDFFGSRLCDREGLLDPQRYELVGLVSTGGAPLRAGAHVVEGRAELPGPSIGYVSSTTWSVARREEIALALVKGGRERIGTTMHAADPVHGRHLPVRIVAPVFYDPDGSQMRM